MDYWSVLGLPADANIRAIKREYARQLKVTRPDDDPVAFQRLRDAYEAALAVAKAREERPESYSPTTDTNVPAPTTPSAPTAAPVQPELPRAAPRAPIMEVVAPARTDLARAAQLVEHLTIANSAERLSLARAWDCLNAFEEQLLLKLGAEGDAQLLEWALVSFQWLSPWQRLDLPAADMDRVMLRLQQATETTLRGYLDAGDVEAFKLERIRLLNSTWLQPFERREWLSLALARVLLQSPFWSVLLVDFLNAAHGWDRNEVARPVMPLWLALARRREEHHAEQRLNEMRTSTDRHVARATRLLFGELTDAQRRSFGRSFDTADWRACEKVANDVQAHYPSLRRQVAGGNLFFWTVLRDSRDDWVLHGAVCLATVNAVLRSYWDQGSSVSATTFALLIGLALTGAGGWLVLKLCNLAASRFQAAEQLLSRPLASRAKQAAWLPSPLGEMLPALLAAGVALIFGGGATLLTYLLTLLLLLAMRGYAPRQSQKVKRQIQRFTKQPKLYVSILAAILMVVLIFGGRDRLGHNQGLQAWAQRTCLADEDSRPCQVPGTQEQWYAGGAR